MYRETGEYTQMAAMYLLREQEERAAGYPAAADIHRVWADMYMRLAVKAWEEGR